MKKLSLLIVILVATCTVALAQPRAVGLRLAWGIGASYQHSIGEKNMIQVDLDFPAYYAGIQAVGTYNWIFPISSWTGPGAWNWYAGVGFGAGYAWRGDIVRWGRGYYGGWYGGYSYGGCGFVGVAGMIGVEYNFKFPLQLFADYRPLVGPCFYKKGYGHYNTKTGKVNNVDFYYSGLISSALCIGARYKF